MKLSNIIGFTQYIQKLVSESNTFVQCAFIANDTEACLRISFMYVESYANGGISMYGHIAEDVKYEEFNKDDFDPIKLG